MAKQIKAAGINIKSGFKLGLFGWTLFERQPTIEVECGECCLEFVAKIKLPTKGFKAKCGRCGSINQVNASISL